MSAAAASVVDPRLHLREVRFAYESAGSEDGPAPFRLAVDDLRVEGRERVAVIGPSGCGKSTLLHLAAGILVADSGRIVACGRELGPLGESERRAFRSRRIGLLFQDFALLDYLDALGNILLPYRIGAGLRPNAEARERALALAERTGLGGLLRRRPHRLSQGERQRVALCRALVTEPDLLLCDEPTGNLDPIRAGDAIDLVLEEAARTGAAVVVVTHDHGLLDRFDRTVDLAPRAAAGAAAVAAGGTGAGAGAETTE